MERVVKYVNDKFKHAGHSREARSQKEELIAGLHDKISDAMSKGKSEDEAFHEAVASLDGMEELTQALNAKSRTVYVNKLNFHQSLITFWLIALEILAFGAFYQMGWRTLPSWGWSYPNIPCFDMYTVSAILQGFWVALFASALYPLVCGIIYSTNPGKVKQMEFDFPKRMIRAMLGWLAVVLVLTMLNVAPIEKAAGPAIWFQWPALAMASWPLSVLIYGWLYRRKTYLAK